MLPCFFKKEDKGMKKIIAICLVCIITLFYVEVNAQQDVTVIINGQVLRCDVPPQIVNDRTMLPVRAIFEALGAKVTWVGDDQLVFATKGDCMITLKIGVDRMSVQRAGENGNIAVALDTAPYILNDRTLVPARAVAEALDAKVDWVNETRTVVIITE